MGLHVEKLSSPRIIIKYHTPSQKEYVKLCIVFGNDSYVKKNYLTIMNNKNNTSIIKVVKLNGLLCITYNLCMYHNCRNYRVKFIKYCKHPILLKC